MQRHPLLYQISLIGVGLSAVSLALGTSVPHLSSEITPHVTGYYANYDTYFNNPCNPSQVQGSQASSAGHAISSPGYPIFGAASNAPIMNNTCQFQTSPGSDRAVLNDGWISLTPLMMDVTSHHILDQVTLLDFSVSKQN